MSLIELISQGQSKQFISLGFRLPFPLLFPADDSLLRNVTKFKANNGHCGWILFFDYLLNNFFENMSYYYEIYIDNYLYNFELLASNFILKVK